MAITSVHLFLYCILIHFLGIRSLNDTTINCTIHEQSILDHNCTCGYFGSLCSISYMKLKGQGLPFLGLLVGNFSKIESIDVTGNEEEFTIPYNLFKPFVNLKSLRIHNCNVVDVETGAFRSLTELVRLEISWNSFLTYDSITNGLDQLNSSKLEVLNISGSHNAEDLLGAFIRTPMFESLANSSLKVLDLSWTRLITLLAPFSLLPHLETLNISGTPLLGTSVCVSTLLSLRNLSDVVLDHWPFFPRGFDNFLYSEEPKGLFKRNAARSCNPEQYVSDNGCVILGTSIRTLQTRYVDLDSLFLDFNKDVCIEENNIWNHIMSHSKISRQIGVIIGYHKLKLFDMSYPEVLFDGPLIKPHMFYTMIALKTLRLAGFYLNRLNYKHIEKLFSQNQNLTELDLSHNDLVKIPKKMFLENTFLEYLNISWNKLTVFDPDLSACTNLLSVDLRHNILKHLGINVIQHISYLETGIDIVLVENELGCDCRLLNAIKNENLSMTPFLCDYNDKRILISENVSQGFVNSVCDNQLVNGNSVKIAIVVGVVVSLVVTVLVIVVAVIICRRKNKTASKSKTADNINMPAVVSLQDWTNVRGSPPRNPKFILFLAYCSKDYEFVITKIYHKLNTKLMQFLPQIDPNQLIIVHDKNFLLGIDIDEICRVAIIESHVTVAVVTENFLESPWCNLEVKMAISSKVPLLPLFITKCDVQKLTGFLRVVYEEKVRLLWPETSALDNLQAEAEENKLLDTLCTHIITYVKLHQQNKECSLNSTLL